MLYFLLSDSRVSSGAFAFDSRTGMGLLEVVVFDVVHTSLTAGVFLVTFETTGGNGFGAGSTHCVFSVETSGELRSEPLISIDFRRCSSKALSMLTGFLSAAGGDDFASS